MFDYMDRAHSLESCWAALYCGVFFNFTQFVILENLSIFDLALSGVKELNDYGCGDGLQYCPLFNY